MRLGGPVRATGNDPEEWILELQKSGYTAAYCPDAAYRDSSEIAACREAALKADIVIAEVGAWSNSISRDEGVRKSAIELCQSRLALAEEIGARCCVNISGSRGDKWDGPHPDNFSDETFQLVVDSVREIIDAVKPRHTFYTLETMPWIFPDSADGYLDLIRAIDRKAFAVHLDPVNLVSSPRRYFENGHLIQECFRKLGPYIKSCHAKDIALSDGLTVHLSETRPGLGGLDYRMYLREIRSLGRDVPLMLEHLPSMEEYRLAATYIRSL
ncbi:sugar phosphate isomerase/epimerase family protein [Paenibacillus sp. MBLB4367]|uniref:sugar phosphate isomerase/epimerase family protein n=1 Tax=Paenibacillus sp. MBLB4367 TaxID=3384767 RepID=UPI0039081CF7